MAGSRPSAVGEGASAVGGLARDRWLARQPLPAVAHAARTQQWQGAVRWALGEALQAVSEAAAATDDLDLVMFEGGPSMRDWLFNAVTYDIVSPWDLKASSIVATAYERTLLTQRQCRREGKQAIARIARCMRDVVVMAAISDAGGHSNQDAFKLALSEAFGRRLDKDMGAQLEHSYHQLLHGIPGAFVSGCKRGRLRPARVRQPADESTSEAEVHECDLHQPRADVAEAVQHAESTDGALPPAPDPRRESEVRGVPDLRRMLEVESARLWNAVERARAENGSLGMEVRDARGSLEHLQAERVHLVALSEREGEPQIDRFRTSFDFHDPMRVWRHEALDLGAFHGDSGRDSDGLGLPEQEAEEALEAEVIHVVRFEAGEAFNGTRAGCETVPAAPMQASTLASADSESLPEDAVRQRGGLGFEAFQDAALAADLGWLRAPAGARLARRAASHPLSSLGSRATGIPRGRSWQPPAGWAAPALAAAVLRCPAARSGAAEERVRQSTPQPLSTRAAELPVSAQSRLSVDAGSANPERSAADKLADLGAAEPPACAKTAGTPLACRIPGDAPLESLPELLRGSPLEAAGAVLGRSPRGRLALGVEFLDAHAAASGRGAVPRAGQFLSGEALDACLCLLEPGAFAMALFARHHGVLLGDAGLFARLLGHLEGVPAPDLETCCSLVRACLAHGHAEQARAFFAQGAGASAGCASLLGHDALPLDLLQADACGAELLARFLEGLGGSAEVLAAVQADGGPVRALMDVASHDPQVAELCGTSRRVLSDALQLAIEGGADAAGRVLLRVLAMAQPDLLLDFPVPVPWLDALRGAPRCRWFVNETLKSLEGAPHHEFAGHATRFLEEGGDERHWSAQ